MRSSWSDRRRRSRSASLRSSSRWCSTACSGSRPPRDSPSCLPSRPAALHGRGSASFPPFGSRRRSSRSRFASSADARTRAAGSRPARISRKSVTEQSSDRQRSSSRRSTVHRGLRRPCLVRASITHRCGGRSRPRWQRPSRSVAWRGLRQRRAGSRCCALRHRSRTCSGRHARWSSPRSRRWCTRAVRRLRSARRPCAGNRRRCGSMRSTACSETDPANGRASRSRRSRTARSSGSSRPTATRSRSCSARRTWRHCRSRCGSYRRRLFDPRRRRFARRPTPPVPWMLGRRSSATAPTAARRCPRRCLPAPTSNSRSRWMERWHRPRSRRNAPRGSRAPCRWPATKVSRSLRNSRWMPRRPGAGRSGGVPPVAAWSSFARWVPRESCPRSASRSRYRRSRTRHRSWRSWSRRRTSRSRRTPRRPSSPSRATISR